MPNVPPDEFPALAPGNHSNTSNPTRKYNCIAWAMGESHRRWDTTPGHYWPLGLARSWTIDGFDAAFATRGYLPCADGASVAGVEKVVLYAKPQGQSIRPSHAALQLLSGKWTSKLGHLDDIEHDDPDVLSGPGYGQPIKYYSRARQAAQALTAVSTGMAQTPFI